MELLLIRHGRPLDAISGVDERAGGVDPGLHPEGAQQAARLADSLARGDYGKVTALVSSSMLRAKETAQPVVDRTGLVLTIDPRLVELDDGASEYKAGLERPASRAAMWQSVNDGRWGAHRFDPRAFLARVLAGMDAVVDASAADPDAIVAVICHGGVISAYLGHVMRTEKSFFFGPAYASVSRVHATADGYRELFSANETFHLR